MTIDEAIKHCEEKAKELYKEADTEHNCNHKELGQYCFKCAKEHEQLAEWLKELKEFREKNNT